MSATIVHHVYIHSRVANLSQLFCFVDEGLTCHATPCTRTSHPINVFTTPFLEETFFALLTEPRPQIRDRLYPGPTTTGPRRDATPPPASQVRPEGNITGIPTNGFRIQMSLSSAGTALPCQRGEREGRPAGRPSACVRRRPAGCLRTPRPSRRR